MSKIYQTELSIIAKGATISFTGKILGGGIQYLYIILIARLLGVEFFGLFMLGVTIINLAGIFCRLGLDNGVLRYVPLYNGMGDSERVKGAIVQSLKYSFIMSLLVGVILYLTADTLAIIFNKPALEGVIKILSFFLPFMSFMNIALSSTQGFKIMKYMVYGYNLFFSTSNLILVLIFSLIGLRLNGVVFAHGLSLFFTAFLSMHYLKKTFPDIQEVKTVPETRELFRFSIPLLVSISSAFLIQWTDTLMLGHFRSSAEVGIYNAAMKTALLTSVILASFNTIFAPIISDLYNRKEKQKLESLFKTVTKWGYMISFPLFLLIILLSKEIMGIYGQEFIIGWKSLIILAVAQLINAGVGSTGFMLAMSGKQDLLMHNTLGICFLNIILNYFLIPIYGQVGASIASGISIIIYNLVMILQVYVILKIHPYSIKFLKPTLFGLVSFGVVLVIKYFLLDLNGLQELLVYIPLFLILFSGLTYVWGIDDEDRFIIDIFKRKFFKTAR